MERDRGPLTALALSRRQLLAAAGVAGVAGATTALGTAPPSAPHRPRRTPAPRRTAEREPSTHCRCPNVSTPAPCAECPAPGTRTPPA
ncbi:twin-arginine translocation signal domain-containing protein [Streptomyces sp. NBC_01384]|uniref:twin-arginine translocation signal domain-containing protein n=1 Tax=Streptomyces sp. NBC_01384 TaxID=2903847 RepID=UPI003867E71B